MLKPLKDFKELPQPSVILLALCSCLLLDKACQLAKVTQTGVRRGKREEEVEEEEVVDGGISLV